ncbi:MAG TPA: (d)CMP kinase [Bacilli bacterium]
MKDQDVKINIAIDGPAGAGKSTVARKVADALGYIYVDTGAMYRAVTWTALQQNLKPDDLEQLIQLVRNLEIHFIPGGNGQQVIVNGADVTHDIRSAEVNKHVSYFSQVKEVRELLVHRQQDMALTYKGVVMDGRDIGTRVLPDSELKVFLTASVHERAERRFKELTGHQPNITLDQLKMEIAGRDELDENREISPLIQANDAILLDCTNMSISEVVEQILKLWRTIMDEAK